MRLAAAPETPTAATPDAWVDVLAGLTGLHLVVLDELLNHGEATTDEIIAGAAMSTSAKMREAARREGAVENALHWLAHHRLAQRGGSGRWRGRTIPQAMPIFLERGPDRAHTFTLGGSLGAQEGRADRRSQGHETAPAEAAKGDTFTADPADPAKPAPKAEPAPIRAVHAPTFFDFGDY